MTEESDTAANRLKRQGEMLYWLLVPVFLLSLLLWLWLREYVCWGHLSYGWFWTLCRLPLLLPGVSLLTGIILAAAIARDLVRLAPASRVTPAAPESRIERLLATAELTRERLGSGYGVLSPQQKSPIRIGLLAWAAIAAVAALALLFNPYRL